MYRGRFGGDVLVEGDIRDLHLETPRHDLLTGGFPCQSFSSAGKKRGVRDSRGTLFQTIVQILAAREPDYFVLENVKRLLSMEQGAHFATILLALTELDYRVEWRLLNAMDFGLSQNRQRVVMLGVHHRRLRSSVASRSFLAEKPDGLLFSDFDSTPTTGWKGIDRHSRRFATWGVAEKGKFVGNDLSTFHAAGKPPPLKAVLQSDQEIGATFDFTKSTRRRLDESVRVDRFVQGVEILSNQSGGARMGYTVFGVNGVAPTLTAATSRHYERYRVGSRYRRLTNVEYARLQGFPDDHCRETPVYDQYRMYGNAVPPPMVAWVLERLARDVVPTRRAIHAG